MRALDKLKAAVTMKPLRRSIQLPNGEEFEFYMTPLTLAERAKAKRQAKSDDANDFALQLLMNKAKDENGQAMFAPGELAELRNALPASLMESLMLQLLADEVDDEEEEVAPLDLKSAGEGTEKRQRSAG